MTRATIIWFVGAAVVGAVAGGLHLLRSQIGGAHTGVPLAVGAFGLTALAAVMLFHGVMTAAREQDALAGPEPMPEDDRDVEPVPQAPVPQAPGEQVAPEQKPGEQQPGTPSAAYEPEEAPAPGGDTAYDAPAAEEGPEVYTFRRGRPVRDQAGRGGRPPRRDRPA